MTDVTGFGLLGHLVEMAEGSNLSAEINFSNIPLITPDLFEYLERKAVPGGTNRNWDSYGHKITIDQEFDLRKNILADPQTSGGLLIAVKESGIADLQKLFLESGLEHAVKPIGKIISKRDFVVSVL
jgi:selenide,water dikinase